MLEQMIVLNPECISTLLDNGISDKITGRICDSKASIRERGCSLAKVMCQVGGEQVCDYMVSQDILTPILDLFSKMKVSVHIVDENVRQQFQGILLHVLGIMHELCQSSEQATNLVSANPEIGSLLDFLDPNHSILMDVRCAAAHVLQDLVEDCPAVVDAVRASNKAAQLIQTCIESPDLLLRSLCIGIQFELDGNCAKCAQLLAPILSLQLPQTLLMTKGEALAAAQESVKDDSKSTVAFPGPGEADQDDAQEDDEDESNLQSGGAMDVDLPPAPQSNGPAFKIFATTISQWTRAAEAQQQALETLANIFSSMALGAEEFQVVQHLMPFVATLCEVQLQQVDETLGDKLLAAVPALDGAVDKLQRLQLRALHCLNNALIGIQVENLKPAMSLWTPLTLSLGQAIRNLQGLQNQSGDEDELLDSLAQCLWSLARNFGETKSIAVLPQHLAMLCGGLGARLSLLADVSMAGCLGSLAPFFRSNANLTSAIAGALIQACQGAQDKTLLLAEVISFLI